MNCPNGPIRHNPDTRAEPDDGIRRKAIILGGPTAEQYLERLSEDELLLLGGGGVVMRRLRRERQRQERQGGR